MKTLVAYYSASGTTTETAKMIAEETGAALFEIKAQKPYTDADLNWKNPLARCNREKILNADVPVQGTVAEFSAYDTVYLGFPIWYYGAPNIIRTFVKDYDWSGKKVVLFATSGGSSFGKTVDHLKPFMKNGTIVSTKLLNGMSREDIQAWLRSQGSR